MNLDFDSIVILTEDRISELADLEKSDDPFANWHAPWRPESLNHYIETGWSTGFLNKEKKLCAYFLAKPIPFFDGMTQVLWIEHLKVSDELSLNTLLQFIYKLAREKNIQSIYISKKYFKDNLVECSLPIENYSLETYRIKTSKWKEL